MFLVGKILFVDIDGVGHLRLLGRPDDLPKVLELLQVDVSQFKEPIGVERCVVKAVADGLHHEDMLDRGHHLLDVVRLHLRAGDGYDGTVVQELAENAASVRFGRVVLRHAARDLSRLGQHLQRTVRREVERIAVGFHLAAEVARTLHAEDRLHVLCGGRDRASGDHEDGRPFGNRHAGRELAA